MQIIHSMSTRTALAAVALLAASAADATILTFDPVGGVTNFEVIAQDYGDNVTMSPDANGNSYGFGSEGATPNVTLAYGTPGEDPSLWTTGYGNLTNVHFNDTDGDTTFTTRFTAGTGFLVDLYSFDIASFLPGGQTIRGLSVTDAATATTLYSVGSTFITGTTRNSFDFSANPLSGADLLLVIDLTGLGGASDDIGLDNIRFGQSAIVTPPTGGVPEPTTWAMMIGGMGMVGSALRRRERLVVTA